jgi:hypothetical protein
MRASARLSISALSRPSSGHTATPALAPRPSKPAARTAPEVREGGDGQQRLRVNFGASKFGDHRGVEGVLPGELTRGAAQFEFVHHEPGEGHERVELLGRDLLAGRVVDHAQRADGQARGGDEGRPRRTAPRRPE